MPSYSAIFQGCVKPTTVIVSLRPTCSAVALPLRCRRSAHRVVASLKPSFPCRQFMALSSSSVYVPPHLRQLGNGRCLSGGDVYSSRGFRGSSPLILDWKVAAIPNFYPRSLNYGRYAYQDESSDESEPETGSSMSGSTLENLEDWRWKLTMLMRNKGEQEVVSREKKDRRDFQQISAVAERMGLYGRQYSKVVVFSKNPLPNYRPDLDDKRPLREVILPFGVQREVSAHLNSHLSKKSLSRGSSTSSLRSSSGGSLASEETVNGQREPVLPDISTRERMYRRKSLQMRDQQQEWLDSPEGQKMIDFRKSLPAYKEKDALLKSLAQNQVIVVSGETGCGKTTQLPQYILESEIEAARGAVCNIICTQPRRISAMSVAERVAAERGEKLGESVGYKVRLEGMKGKDTRLLFCTTGVLLRRLLLDRDLRGVTHVIVDEIHERGMNEDFLLIVLKDLLPRRPDLRLVLMSATLNAELFSSYFGGAPTLHIPGFTYPVRAQFLENILETTGYRLTLNNQIDDYGQEKTWKMQKQTQGFRKRKSQIASDTVESTDFRGYSHRTQESLSNWNPDSIGFNLIEHVLCHIVKNERPGAVLVFMTGWDDINSLKDQLQAHPVLGDPSKVLLLACHGSMASSEQRLIFDKPEDGLRKIVLATNMAETSITINDVVFVVDCGKAKETSYDALNNTPCLLPTWISKASARQRRGRAGRVQPGECYHLYPKCVYDAFSDYQLPELLRTPLQSLCLQIKSLQLGSISEFLSQALQAPEAFDHLTLVRAYDGWKNAERDQSGYEYCWRNFLSAQTLKAIDSLRKQFFFLLKDANLIDQQHPENCNTWSQDVNLVRAVICAGLFPGICSVVVSLIRLSVNFSSFSSDYGARLICLCMDIFVFMQNREKSIALKTMEDGQVLLYSVTPT
ncbi:unnamed protein product [Linum tenue]|uniref:RNA helicase n=1 Tax=Linum tenue TaxID=586396 RepID=A0AAV0ISZ4_9ROSI|nr:unnamed protein product [Linum tenue]